MACEVPGCRAAGRTLGPVDDRARHLEHLAAEAKDAEQRLRLYRAKAYGGRTTSDVRMRELELRARQTAERLAAARAATP